MPRLEASQAIQSSWFQHVLELKREIKIATFNRQSTRKVAELFYKVIRKGTD